MPLPDLALAANLARAASCFLVAISGPLCWQPERRRTHRPGWSGISHGDLAVFVNRKREIAKAEISTDVGYPARLAMLIHCLNTALSRGPQQRRPALVSNILNVVRSFGSSDVMSLRVNVSSRLNAASSFSRNSRNVSTGSRSTRFSTVARQSVCHSARLMPPDHWSIETRESQVAQPC